MDKSSKNKAMPNNFMDVALIISMVAALVFVAISVMGLMETPDAVGDPAAIGHGHMH